MLLHIHLCQKLIFPLFHELNYFIKWTSINNLNYSSKIILYFCLFDTLNLYLKILMYKFGLCGFLINMEFHFHVKSIWTSCKMFDLYNQKKITLWKKIVLMFKIVWHEFMKNLMNITRMLIYRYIHIHVLYRLLSSACLYASSPYENNAFKL